MQERRLAEAKAKQEEAVRRAETPDPDAELDPELEAKAAEIEKAFEIAQAGSGACSKNQHVSSSSIDGKKVSTISKTFSVKNPDGSEWRAVIEKRNGVVTKAERQDPGAHDQEKMR